MELEWFGPLTFPELIGTSKYKARFDEQDPAGVYLWVERQENNERIYYIGKATGRPSIWKRNLQHYMHFIGGLHTIPESPARKAWVPSPEINVGMIHTVLDENKFMKLVHQGFNYVRQLEIYISPLEAHLVANVERNLLYDLRPEGTKPGTKTRPREEIRIIHKNALWASQTVRRHHNLAGRDFSS